MKGGLKLILGAGAILGIYFLNKGRGATKLDFGFETLDLSDFKLSQMKINSKMRVTNPMATSQSVDAIFGNIYLPDGTKLGRMEITTPQAIPPRQSTILTVPIILSPIGLGKLTALMIQTRGEIPTFKIKGVLVTYGINLPIDQTI